MIMNVINEFEQHNQSIYIYIYIYKQKPHAREHEVLPSGTLIE